MAKQRLPDLIPLDQLPMFKVGDFVTWRELTYSWIFEGQEAIPNVCDASSPMGIGPFQINKIALHKKSDWWYLHHIQNIYLEKHDTCTFQGKTYEQGFSGFYFLKA